MPQMKNMMIHYRIFCNSLRRTYVRMALLPYPIVCMELLFLVNEI